MLGQVSRSARRSISHVPRDAIYRDVPLTRHRVIFTQTRDATRGYTQFSYQSIDN